MKKTDVQLARRCVKKADKIIKVFGALSKLVDDLDADMVDCLNSKHDNLFDAFDKAVFGMDGALREVHNVKRNDFVHATNNLRRLFETKASRK